MSDATFPILGLLAVLAAWGVAAAVPAEEARPRNNPVLLAGGGLKHGGHVAHDALHNTPLANLFVCLLQEMKHETDSFATSTGVLCWER